MSSSSCQVKDCQAKGGSSQPSAPSQPCCLYTSVAQLDLTPDKDGSAGLSSSICGDQTGGACVCVVCRSGSSPRLALYFCRVKSLFVSKDRKVLPVLEAVGRGGRGVLEGEEEGGPLHRDASRYQGALAAPPTVAPQPHARLAHLTHRQGQWGGGGLMQATGAFAKQSPTTMCILFPMDG